MGKLNIPEKNFLQGFAMALGSLARIQGRPETAADICVCCGVSLAQLKAAEVEAYDLEGFRLELQRREQAQRRPAGRQALQEQSHD